MTGLTMLSLLAAVLVAAGLLLVVMGFMRSPARMSKASLAALMRTQLDADTLREFAGRGTDRAVKAMRTNSQVVQDCNMVGRSPETHAFIKVGATVGAGFGTAIVGALAGAMFGLGFNVPLVGLAGLCGAGAGWLLPDSVLRTAAQTERDLFQPVAEAWLELVAQLVTAGADAFGALLTAATFSEQPGFVLIRDTLRAGAASGTPPWTALRQMSEERRLSFLDPFIASLELTGTTGAGARQAILAQVDASRSQALFEADAAAASAGEKAGAPLALIGGAFMVLMGYPPLAGVMSAGTLPAGAF